MESMRINIEKELKTDEQIRRDLLQKMMLLKDSDDQSFVLGPIIDVLQNFEGILDNRRAYLLF